MSFSARKSVSLGLAVCSLFLILVFGVQAQSTGSLIGIITDPSNSIIPKASVRLTLPDGSFLDTTTNKDGVYEFKNLSPGTYSIKAIAKGFALFTQNDVAIASGNQSQLNISLTIQVEQEKVVVNDSPTNVAVDPANNAGMIVLKDKDLEALSDDPDELQSELQALAGPSAGPNGGQIYIDGFTGGTLPPKASIREIRINQNPFSAEYDKLGYGRIEIFTKPGTDQYHGQVFLTGNTADFNSRNPFETISPGTTPPGYHSTQFSANVGGPMGKKASFFFNIERRDINELSVTSGQTVDPTTLLVVPFSDALNNPRTRTNLSPRLDYQVSTNNTLTVRYQFEHENQINDGIGGFSRPSAAYNQLNNEHQIQITDTQIINAKIINETRFRFIRETAAITPQGTAPTLSVQGAFTDGGYNGGVSNDALDRYELQNYTSMSAGKHFIKYGVRLRINRDQNLSSSNFNGTFTFSSRPDPTNPGCTATPPLSSCTQITGIDAYQTTLKYLAGGNTPANLQLAIVNGGGASYYSITTGNAAANVTYVDASLHLQDDWRVRPNITLSYGLRCETQNNLGDHADFAPRVGIAWGVAGDGKKPPKTVIRGGFGLFYDRFTYDLVLQQQRFNGVSQQQYLVANPNFYLFNIPSLSSLPPGSTSTVYVPNNNLRAPYVMQTGATLERQLTKVANLSVTYLNSRGVHQFYTDFINAPTAGATPPSQFNYQYQSGGIFKQNQLIVNSSIRAGQNLSLFGYYTLNYSSSDTSGVGSLPSTPGDIALDYGRASFDVRHRVFFGGTMGFRYGFRLSPFMIASSGSPFNITTGQTTDTFGNAAYNIRPTLGTCPPGSKDPKPTAYGCFNLVTLPGQSVIPINEFTGPGRFTLNLRLSKTFGFGLKKEAQNAGGGGGLGSGGTFGRGGGGGGGPRGGGMGGGGGMFGGAPSNSRYNLTFSINARNVFNNVNVTNPIGNLSSPLFGQSNSLAGNPFSSPTANRRIDLQASFNF